MIIFLTGGTGFIGKRLVGALENNNTSITLLSKVHQQGFETVVCDLKSDQVPCNSLSSPKSIQVQFTNMAVYPFP